MNTNKKGNGNIRAIISVRVLLNDVAEAKDNINQLTSKSWKNEKLKGKEQIYKKHISNN